MAELKREGVEIETTDAVSFATGATPRADLVLPMCQGPRALKRLAKVEQAGAVAINSALSIRNCYRDLLAPGLERAGVPTPPGALVPADEPLDARKLAGLDLSAGVFVKRGDLHALAPEDVQRAADRAEIEAILADFARRGIRFAYVQQEVVGPRRQILRRQRHRAFQRASRGRGSGRGCRARAVGSGCGRGRGARTRCVGRRRDLEWRSICDYRF